MRYFAGPFIGEFGWELCYWHGWLRRIKHEFLPDQELIVSSYPGRYPFYEFASEFIKLPEWFLKKNYSQRDFLLDIEDSSKKEQKEDLKRLIFYYKELFNDDETFFIFNYPQKNHETRFFHKLSLRLKRFLPKKRYHDLKSFLESCNDFNGIPLEGPLFLEWPERFNAFTQRPNSADQVWINLSASKLGAEKRDSILKDYDQGRPIFPLFPRKRLQRRPDKNWPEESGRDLISLLIEEFDPIIILCGAPSGAYFSGEKNTRNIINIIDEDPEIILDLQLAFLDIAEVSIHGRSGSCYLSFQNGCKTFMAGPEKDRERICILDNPTKGDILYYTDYGVCPPVEKFFEKFKNYYLGQI